MTLKHPRRTMPIIKSKLPSLHLPANLLDEEKHHMQQDPLQSADLIINSERKVLSRWPHGGLIKRVKKLQIIQQMD